MKTNELNREQISAFADGELGESECKQALALLKGEQSRADWELYHTIGDILRSDETQSGMSSTFSSSLAARLAAEPVYIAPAPIKRNVSRTRVFRNIAGAVAVATFAFVVTPPLIDAFQGPGDQGIATVAAVPEQPIVPVVATPAADGVILRDPRIDDYLMAHQRFSPSANGSAQYARSATYSGK